MSRLEQRLERLESSASADNAPPKIIVSFIEPRTMRVVGRLRMVAGGAVPVDEDGNDIAPGGERGGEP